MYEDVEERAVDEKEPLRGDEYEDDDWYSGAVLEGGPQYASKLR